MPPEVRLCASAQLIDSGTAHVWNVLQHGQPERAFVLRHDGVVRAYLNRCLHVPVELDWQPGEFLDSDKRFIICSIHGATYQPADGKCVGGPCGRGRLTPVAVREHGGQVHWYPSADLQPMPPSGSPPSTDSPLSTDSPPSTP